MVITDRVVRGVHEMDEQDDEASEPGNGTTTWWRP